MKRRLLLLWEWAHIFQFPEENANALYAIIVPGARIMDWKGIRVYLRMKEYVTSGPKLGEIDLNSPEHYSIFLPQKLQPVFAIIPERKDRISSFSSSK
jgi:hypothetical protein